MEKKFKLEKIDLLLCALGLLYIFMQISSTPVFYEYYYGYGYNSPIGFFSTLLAIIVLAVPTVLAVLFRKKLPILVIAGAAFFSISEHIISLANQSVYVMIDHSLLTPYAIIMYLFIPAFIVAMIMSKNKAVMKIASLVLLGMYATFSIFGGLIDGFSYYCSYSSNIICWYNFLPYLICGVSLASTAFSPDGISEPSFKIPFTTDIASFVLHAVAVMMVLGSLSIVVTSFGYSARTSLYNFFRQFILILPFIAAFVVFRKNNIKLFILVALITTSLMEFATFVNGSFSIMSVLMYLSSLIYTAALIIAMIKYQNKTFAAITGLVLIAYPFVESLMFSLFGSLANNYGMFFAPNEFHVLAGIALLEYAIFAPSAPVTGSYEYTTTGYTPSPNPYGQYPQSPASFEETVSTQTNYSFGNQNTPPASGNFSAQYTQNQQYNTQAPSQTNNVQQSAEQNNNNNQ